MAVKLRLKKKKQPPKNEGEILDPGESWYRLKPEKIELIYNRLFGFEKKMIKLS